MTMGATSGEHADPGAIPRPARLLDGHQIEELATVLAAKVTDAVGQRLDALWAGALPQKRLVDATTLADLLGVTRSVVYAHADELGARRLGTGSRPRLRFDAHEALAEWTARSASKSSADCESPANAQLSASGRRSIRGQSAPLLPVRAPKGASEVTSAKDRDLARRPRRQTERVAKEGHRD